MVEATPMGEALGFCSSFSSIWLRKSCAWILGFTCLHSVQRGMIPPLIIYLPLFGIPPLLWIPRSPSFTGFSGISAWHPLPPPRITIYLMNICLPLLKFKLLIDYYKKYEVWGDFERILIRELRIIQNITDPPPLKSIPPPFWDPPPPFLGKIPTPPLLVIFGTFNPPPP